MAYLSHNDSLAFARQKVTFHEQMFNRLKYRCLANEGFKTSSKVQYVARVGNFIDGGEEYTGALQILKVILSYDYLWQNVRMAEKIPVFQTCL